jgi:hypothetical protein
LSVLTYTYLYSSILFFSSISLPLPHSFYTCRYLHILIYIIFRYSQTSYLSILKGVHIYL